MNSGSRIPVGIHWLPALLVILVLTLLFVPIAQSGRAEKALMDLCHGPLFFVLAGGICWSIRGANSSRKRAVWVWVWVAGLGMLTEMIQQWTGRQPSWQDALANVLGATSGVLASDPQLIGGKWRSYLLSGGLLMGAMASPIAVLIDAAHQHWQMPTLSSFESPVELSRWTTKNCQVQRVRQHATSGDWALRADLQPSRYPGLAISEVPQDWTPYREFAFDVTLTTPESLSLFIKITDEPHNWESDDRFHYEAKLQTGLNRIRIPLRDVQHAPKGRLMLLSRMQMLQFFAVNLNTTARIYLDNIRLIADPPDSQIGLTPETAR